MQAETYRFLSDQEVGQLGIGRVYRYREKTAVVSSVKQEVNQLNSAHVVSAGTDHAR